jgi:hypothetical protein
MLVYAITIFISAFLLFQVQPMIAKMILPWFGGSAAVWSTSMMFFQIILVVGYLYSYCTIRYLKPRQQTLLHITILGLGLLLLPIVPSAGWKPTGDADPTFRILGLLAATIGLPYLLLSTTGPLLQAWYLQTHKGVVPYRLFALSNFGSMLALLSFPFAVEPYLTTRHQAILWSVCYGLFTVCCAYAGWRSRGGVQRHEDTDAAPEPIAWSLLSLWIVLPACAAVMLLAFTTHMSQNIAPIPFLWVVPLSIYLLSFILCFERENGYERQYYLPLLPLALGAVAFAIYANDQNASVKWAIPTFAIALFVCCMVCHGELARLKPHPRQLTLYYLMISVGGALGGMFVALIAPRIFHTDLELPLSLVVCALLIALLLRNESLAFFGPRFGSNTVVRVGLILLTVGLAVYLGYHERLDQKDYKLSLRNFYGVMRVRDEKDPGDLSEVRILVHGTINHGEQLLDTRYKHLATTYYGPTSGVGRALLRKQKESPAVRVAVIGLGAGVLASYCRPSDVFRFYEINPLVFQITTSQFTFYHDCPADKQVLFGDARLTMERQPDQAFDLIAVDAFSSDSIPVHLLTREAFALYFRHLKPDGVLAVHTSNHYLDLVPVCAQHAADMKKRIIVVDDDPENDHDYLFSTTWVLLSSDPTQFEGSEYKHEVAAAVVRKDLPTWTDNYSNLFKILK